ncbi:hypothetical protein [Kribbella monticola]|uniref:hypothetical protein n=1 Tax=Kribbella monticola TaxID=2185285 RepID=UPI000DD419B6|nr:hypothetical protein [Kribbella monticola]
MEDLASGLFFGLLLLVGIALAIQGVVWVIVNFWFVILLILIAVAATCIGGYLLKEKYKVWQQAELHKRELHAAIQAEEKAHGQIEATYQQVRDEMIQTAERWDER